MKRFKDFWNSIRSTRNEENRSLDINLNNHSHPTQQVDTSIAKKQSSIKKKIDNELQHRHQLASVAHNSSCHVIHATDARLDCMRVDCWKFEPDVIVGQSYEVTSAMRVGSYERKNINAVKEIGARINEDKPW